MEKLIVASNNKGKIKEIKEILKDVYEIVPMREVGFDEEIEENGSTFFENALIKAKAVSVALGVNALADDSGLCVDALGGAPGIYSARFSGVHGDDAANRKKLLEELKDLKNPEERKAKFVSSVVLYKRGGEVVSGTGETHGIIGFKEEGENGFGYDSLFISDDLDKSFGLATAEEKNAVSHRKRALIDLLRHL